MDFSGDESSLSYEKRLEYLTNYQKMARKWYNDFELDKKACSDQEVSEFLNEYFTEMEPIITQYNGVINKFIGDAVMAIFGEPIQDKNHAQNAVKCAFFFVSPHFH